MDTKPPGGFSVQGKLAQNSPAGLTFFGPALVRLSAGEGSAGPAGDFFTSLFIYVPWVLKSSGL